MPILTRKRKQLCIKTILFIYLRIFLPLVVSSQELKARIHDFYKFSSQEVGALVLATVVTAFVFSFCGWGASGKCSVAEPLSFIVGLTRFFFLVLIAGVVFFFRFTCQKWYGLSEGYKVEYKPWWGGLLIALVLVFISGGRIPLALIGGVSVAFMSKQRLGEFRYGFSYWQNGTISMWGIYSVLICGILFRILYYYFPQQYLFQQGIFISLMTAFLTLLPIPQQEGLNIYFAAPWLYYLAIGLVLLASVLLLVGGAIGLIIGIIIAAGISLFYLAISSEK